jgi:Holliday junction resolvase-like predicted endonuclease
VFVNTRQRGDIGELSAAAWLASRGVVVALPVCHSPDWDLVIQSNGRLATVQVKTCTRRSRLGYWHVMLCTKGGNQSWNGTTKYFEAGRCDYLFVYAGDGRRWFMPSGAVEGRTGITLGGPKYAEYEISRAEPLPGQTDVVGAA